MPKFKIFLIGLLENDFMLKLWKLDRIRSEVTSRAVLLFIFVDCKTIQSIQNQHGVTSSSSGFGLNSTALLKLAKKEIALKQEILGLSFSSQNVRVVFVINEVGTVHARHAHRYAVSRLTQGKFCNVFPNFMKTSPPSPPENFLSCVDFYLVVYFHPFSNLLYG